LGILQGNPAAQQQLQAVQQMLANQQQDFQDFLALDLQTLDTRGLLAVNDALTELGNERTLQIQPQLNQLQNAAQNHLQAEQQQVAQGINNLNNLRQEARRLGQELRQQAAERLDNEAEIDTTLNNIATLQRQIAQAQNQNPPPLPPRRPPRNAAIVPPVVPLRNNIPNVRRPVPQQRTGRQQINRIVRNVRNFLHINYAFIPDIWIDPNKMKTDLTRLSDGKFSYKPVFSKNTLLLPAAESLSKDELKTENHPSPSVISPPPTIESLNSAANLANEATHNRWTRNENPVAEADRITWLFNSLKAENSSVVKLDKNYDELLFVKNDISTGDAYFAHYEVEGQQPTIIVVPKEERTILRLDDVRHGVGDVLAVKGDGEKRFQSVRRAGVTITPQEGIASDISTPKVPSQDQLAFNPKDASFKAAEIQKRFNAANKTPEEPVPGKTYEKQWIIGAKGNDVLFAKYDPNNENPPVIGVP